MPDREKYRDGRHDRRSIRLKDYDYSQQGAYFVTICAKSRRCLFGEIIDGEIRLNEIRDQWVRSTEVRKEIYIVEFVIMPNHLHGIVVIEDNPVGATGGRPVSPKGRIVPGPGKYSLAAFIAGFKSACVRSINQLLATRRMSIWQRNYYEHIIRNEKSLNAIREYILNNPARWSDDPENPETF
jgi:putative transposase